ncbi:MAG: peptide ABC transporter permease, partial [Calditrichaeota bacterium]
MYITEVFKTAAQQLVANRLRSVLTTLGIVIGIGTVILIVSVLEGYRSSIEADLNLLGANTFQVEKYGPRINVGHSRRPPRKDLTIEMANAIRESAPSVKYVGAENWEFGEMVIFEGKRTNPNVMVAGVTPEFIINNGYFVGEGRFITEQDVRSHSHVVILGMDIVDKIFPYTDPMGKEVRIHGQKLRVVGLFESRGNSVFGESRDNRVAIPITA